MKRSTGRATRFEQEAHPSRISTRRSRVRGFVWHPTESESVSGQVAHARDLFINSSAGFWSAHGVRSTVLAQLRHELVRIVACRLSRCPYSFRHADTLLLCCREAALFGG
jgi:hypothetical protein